MKKLKAFLYTDPSFDLAADNVFLSAAVYKDAKDFKKNNPDYKPLRSYSADEVMASWRRSKTEVKKFFGRKLK